MAARRRSARLSGKRSTPDRLGARKTQAGPVQLESVAERDETPEGGPQPTIDAILSSPPGPKGASTKKLDELPAVKTPRTLPRVAHEEMHPKENHQTTTKAPDSGLRLGFRDIPASKDCNTLAAAQNTPSRTGPRASLPQHLTAASFDFKFASESSLSEEARRLMNNVREDAERIKSHIRAEKDSQARKDIEAERLFMGANATGRKIAKPQGKAGRFSDVHMAQFKKMDSIANHVSSFRARPNFAQPTQQSLKRSGSKAGLDESERPRTAGKGTTPGRPPLLFGQTQITSIPRKPFTGHSAESNRLENENEAPAKRRKSTFGDVSAGRAAMMDGGGTALRESTLPRPKGGLSTSLHTPTKASLARANAGKIPPISPGKASLLPRSNSVKSVKAAVEQIPSADDNPSTSSPPKSFGLVPSESTKSVRPLPPLPTSGSGLSVHDLTTTKPLPATPLTASNRGKPSLTSRLPTFQGLKSILRPSRRVTSKPINTPIKGTSAGGTPKRSNTAAPSESGSTKKVDFTPSTKSRYAVKLAATASPSPSKPNVASSTPTSGPLVPYDPAAYNLDDDSNEGEWEDAESEVDYPILSTEDEDIPSTPPVAAVTRSFIQKAREHNRRESKEFKSIFTTLEHPSRSNTPTTLTDVHIKVNVGGPGAMTRQQQEQQPPTRDNSVVGACVKHRPSPSTIRRVRSSGVSSVIQPFQDTIKTVPHGLPGKKRRRESLMKHGLQHDDEDDGGKENRGFSTALPSVPGGWDDGLGEDDGLERAGKRVKIEREPKTKTMTTGGEAKAVKKPNKAREAAARNAKERKTGGPTARPGLQSTGEKKGGQSKGEEKMGAGGAAGILTMSRLNMLSRPKERR